MHVSAERLLIYRQLVRHIESLRAKGKRATGAPARALPVPTPAVFRNKLGSSALEFTLRGHGR
jgi:hypothetical protein